MSYSVTQIEDAALRERMLVKLWTNSELHQSGDPFSKFRWFYQEAPGGAATAFFLTDPSAAESEPIGCCGLGTREVWVDGRPVKAGLFADFAVEPRHRTLMPALTLQRALCGDARNRFPVTYGFPNKAAVGIFQRIGFPLLGTVNRYVKVLRYGSFVERVVHSRALAAPVGAAIDIVMRAGEIGRSIGRSRGDRLEWMTVPDERFDAFFGEARQGHRLIGDRSAAFLRWRFVERPGRPCDFAMLVNETGRMRAYAAVMQKEAGVALVADFLAKDDRALAELFDRLLPVVRARGFNAAITFFLGAPTTVAVLKSSGFQERKSSKYIVVGAGAGLQVTAASLENVADWYLTEADRDN